MSELTYTRSGDYLIPDLSLTEQPQAPLGKYGRMRKDYLKEHRPVLWNSLLLSEKLYPHLREIDEAANNRLEQMIQGFCGCLPGGISSGTDSRYLTLTDAFR